MSLKFNPDDSLLNASWATVLLSERDVAGQVPINFVTSSAISLRAACFGNNTFGRIAAEKCVSNLLAVGYRRFNIDIYWSAELKQWLFCPVSIPQGVHIQTISPDTTPTTTASVAQGTVAAEIDSLSGELLYNLGPYRCSDNLVLSDLLDVFLDFFQDTNSDINVYTRYMSLNLHAAASPTSVDKPPSTVPSGHLPTGSNRVSALIKKKLGPYIYTPSRLFQERSNLNESWYEVDDGYKPIAEYFTLATDSRGILNTPDGWPSTKYIQLAAEKRLLVEYSSVDPQLSGYNLSKENEVIFPLGYLTSTIPLSAGNDGRLDADCPFISDEPNVPISKVNASWAISNHVPIPSNLSYDLTLQHVSNMIVNLTACGIASTLNDTLFNSTADTAPEPYQNISISSSWAWAPGQPQAPPAQDAPEDSTGDRCAVMDLTSLGYWRAASCSEHRRAACRVQNQPFDWRLSSTPLSYEDAYREGCSGNTKFSIPRTGLENTYLYRHLLAQSTDLIDPSSDDPVKREVWLDFNSIDLATCWVRGGPDATCPYSSDPQQLERRTVLVAAIAGIVICIIAALTLFVKCNANRRNSRRNKRVIRGWEYEGVPS